MLLRNRINNPKALTTAGMFCLVFGILMLRFFPAPSDFWQGFVAGLSGVLLGLSIVFNIRGLVLHREQ